MNAPEAFDRNAPSRAANLRLNSDLLAKAKTLNINLSREFEAHLAGLVRQRMMERWLAENKDALSAYNQFVEQNGVFSEGVREF